MKKDIIACYCVDCNSTNYININYDGSNICNHCGNILVKHSEKTTNHSLRRVKAKIFVKEYLSKHPCIHCGETRIWVLDFHHRDPKKKENGINTMIMNRNSTKTIAAEIEKCDVLCSNCHRELHYYERIYDRMRKGLDK